MLHWCVSVQEEGDGQPRITKSLGNGLFSHTVARAVSSVLRGLTTVFGMGTGVPPSPCHPRNFDRVMERRCLRHAPIREGSANHCGARCERALMNSAQLIMGCRTPNLPIRSAAKSSTISTARLNALPRLHLRPINQIISLGSYLSPQSGESGEPNLEAGFPLRCFQRLSIPHVATQQCLWRDNWYTSGASTPVLSY